MSDLVMPAETGQPRPRTKRERNRLLWPIRFLLDNNDDPSATRIMAYLLVGSNMLGHPLDPWTSALVLATCFGYSMFKSVIEKTAMSATATGAISSALSYANSKSHSVAESTSRTFTYTDKGEPAQSLPAQPAATTVGGAP